MKIGIYNTLLNENKHNILVKEKDIDYEEDTTLCSPEIIYNFMVDVFQLDRKAEEYFYMIALDTKCHPLGIFEISHGMVNATLVSPREIYIRGLLCGAVYTIFVHNHPSSNTQPSMEDLKVTRRLKEAGDLVGIKIMDHIIVGESNFYSFKEKGVL